MPDRIVTDLPLEKRLETEADRTGEFPNTSFNYYQKYCEIKRFLAEQYYKTAGAGLALGGERYTLHNIDHVDDVVRRAGDLIGLGAGIPDAAYTKLKPYELFVLLYAILLHDAGNTHGREEHERAPRAILRELGTISGLGEIEQRLVASIAQAHGGKTRVGDKDTITNVIPEPVSSIENLKVHGRRLAALVRLADELSENPRRADPDAVREDFRLHPENAKPPQSVIHNMYCQLINTQVDYRGGSLTIEYQLEKQFLNLKYPIFVAEEPLDIFMVDYIAQRVEKIEMERRYCNRFVRDFVAYDRCRVTLKIYDEYDEAMPPLGLDLEDVGYPVLHNPVKKLKPEFDGAVLQKRFFGAVDGGAQK
jgi:hypothetical protein